MITRDVPYTVENLQKAQKVLDQGLAYIEMCGFDINTELENNFKVTQAWLDDIKKGKVKDIGAGAACFIGSARVGAGVAPGDFYNVGTDGGDGPELSIALELLDRAVPEEYVEHAEERDERSYGGEEDEEDGLPEDGGPGGVAEAYGFIIKETLEAEHGVRFIYPEDEDEEARKAVNDGVAEAALNVYKGALREVHGLIENPPVAA